MFFILPCAVITNYIALPLFPLNISMADILWGGFHFALNTTSKSILSSLVRR